MIATHNFPLYRCLIVCIPYVVMVSCQPNNPPKASLTPTQKTVLDVTQSTSSVDTTINTFGRTASANGGTDSLLSDSAPTTVPVSAISATLATNFPNLALSNATLSGHTFAETFAQNALLADDFHAIGSPSKIQQTYITAIQSMTQAMSSEIDNADILFVKNMLIHHHTAITIANLELKYGKDKTLQTLAEDMLTAQQAEINLLAQWLKSHDNKKLTSNNLKNLQIEYSQNIQDMSNAMLKGVSATSVDRMFVQVLLPHHKGALAMAESELSFGKDKAVRDMAVNIISSQQSEISLMKNWLTTQRKH